MAFLAPLFAAGMSSGIIPGLISKVGGFVSDVLGNVGRGKKLGDAVAGAGSRALRQIAGAPPSQSGSGEAMQNMQISNNLPMHIPAHAVNLMQPKEQQMGGGMSTGLMDEALNALEEEGMDEETLETFRDIFSEGPGRTIVYTEPFGHSTNADSASYLDSELRRLGYSVEMRARHSGPSRAENESMYAAMQPRMRMAERAPQRAPPGALRANGGFVGAPKRRPPPVVEYEDEEDEDDYEPAPPPRQRKRRPAPRKMVKEVVYEEEDDEPPRRRGRAPPPKARAPPPRSRTRVTEPPQRQAATSRRYARVL